MSKNKLDILGNRVGKLVIKEHVGVIKDNHCYRCECDCGGEKIVTRAQLNKGTVSSCGCKKRKLNKEEVENDLKTMTKEEVSKKYGFKSVDRLWPRLRSMGIKSPKNHLMKHDYFKNWSSNMAYILGFITADGCLHPTRPYINIELAEKDGHLLYKFKEEFNHEGNILEYTRYHKNLGKTLTSHKIAIYSEEITTDLNNLGLFPNKTELGIKTDVSKIPDEYFYDYFRGWFDGDGSVCVRNMGSKQYLGMKIVCSDKSFLKQIKERINIESSINGQKTYYILHYGNDVSKLLYKLMYNNKNYLCLNRKKEKFEEVINA